MPGKQSKKSAAGARRLLAHTETASPPPTQSSTGFPIVGIGASAGGVEALKRLFRALPATTGVGLVVVQHLAPAHASMLTEILSRETSMPVAEVEDEPRVQPNRVYVIPPDRDMSIRNGVLQLAPRETQRGQHRSIDYFFRSLAEDQGHRAIGVVLSGSANDGTLGLEEIKAQGGITFAQDDSAQFSDMPRSAIHSGCVDFVLPPDEIAAELARIAQHPYVAQPDRPPGPLGDETDETDETRDR